MKRKRRTVSAPELSSKTPKSFVIRLGKVTKNVKQLEEDLRVTMMPFTAKNLKEQKQNTLRDFVGAASMLKVSHLLVLNQKGSRIRLELARLPGGPSLSFEVIKYSLMRDIRRAWESSRNIALSRNCQKPPLLLLNGFANPPKTAIDRTERIKEALGSMFPSIEVQNLNFKHLNSRVLLVDYCVEKDIINLRHYAIRHRLAGIQNERVMRLYSLMNSNVKKEEPETKKEPIDEDDVMETPSTQSLSGLAEAMQRVKKEPHNGAGDTSRPNTDAKDNVILNIPYRNFVKGRAENNITSDVRVPVEFSLVEIGPRLTLKLEKVYEKAFEGVEINLEEELEGFNKEDESEKENEEEE